MEAFEHDVGGAPQTGRWGAAVIGAFLLLSALIGPVGSEAAASATLNPVADAHVRADIPNGNFGADTSLRVDGSPIANAYLRFDLSGLAPATRAILRLYVTTATGATDIAVNRVANDTWTESTISYSNAPPVGAALGNTGPFGSGQWVSVDVTPSVQGGGLVSLALTTTSQTGELLASREGANKPELVIETVPSGFQPSFPIRAAFYYPWFPEAWTQRSIFPYTRYDPSLGFYSSTDVAVIRKHIRSMQYGGIEAGISSWWGRGTKEDVRFPLLLRETNNIGSRLRWAPYYEQESLGNPSAAAIEADLSHIKSRYASDPAYLLVNGKPVIFVYADGADGCAMADRWKQGNATQGFYIVLKVFAGYTTCPSQPSGWHQYSPASAANRQTGHSYSISPGFWQADATERLARDLARWEGNVRDMVSSNERWQLVTTFNEWGEGTAVESAQEWATPSGRGAYLDALRFYNGDPVIAAAGDIACAPSDPNYNGGLGTATKCAQKRTSDLVVSEQPTAVLTLGDNQYEIGRLSRFLESYDPTWGRVKSITRPTVGNHEYMTAGAAGHFDYYGAAAGPRGKGYYSFDVGSWHLVALNSNCAEVGGCGAGSPQESWLRSDLAAHPNRCTLAYWHHPRFSSGPHGNSAAMQAIWKALYDANADVVLAGHDHTYERFAPQDHTGVADPVRGIRGFVAGTGGKNHYSFGTTRPNSQVRNSATFGVLEFSLHPGSYNWKFEPVAGASFTDSGSDSCH
jgi:hypothetical protein